MKNRVFVIDLLKAFAVIAVICTHFPWENPNKFVMGYFVDMAVPVFMMISGYNLSRSYEKADDRTAKQKVNWVFSHIRHFLIPWLLIFAMEELGNLYLKKEYSAGELLYYFLKGGWGPGAYYVPMLFQLIIVFPFIYRLIKMKQVKGVLAGGVLNLLYELIVHISGLNALLYAIFIFRYLFIITLGCYLYLHKAKMHKSILAGMFMAGSLFIFMTGCREMQLPIFRLRTNVSMLTGLYIFPLIYIIIEKFKNVSGENKIGKSISIVGKYTYYIYLIQMIYYYSGITNVLNDFSIPSQLLINVLLCVGGGIIFGSIMKRINRKMKSKNRGD